MKIKEGFLLREIAGSWIVVPMGQRVVEFNGLISLNDSGAYLWRKLEENIGGEEELVTLLTNEYDVDEDTARLDVNEFLASIREKGLVEYEDDMGTA